MAYNKAILVGNMTATPELKMSQSGKSICPFTVAVKRRFQDATDFHDCVAWGKTAETISRNFRKGKEILVEGELQKRSYTDKEGNKRWVTELVVDNFSFVGRKSEGQFHEVEDDGDLPF